MTGVSGADGVGRLSTSGGEGRYTPLARPLSEKKAQLTDPPDSYRD